MYIKNIKLVLLLTVLYVSIPHLSWATKPCRSSFNEIGKKLSEVDISQYKGQEGYVRFVEELKGTHRMDYVFNKVSEFLYFFEKMEELQWQSFQGTSEDFRYFKKLLSLEVIRKYKGLSGYISFSEEYFEGDMKKTYLNASAVLGRDSILMKQLGWQLYLGSVLEVKELRDKILNEDGSIKEKYKGMSGYVEIAKEYFEGNMKKAYKNVSAILGGEDSILMKQLGWKQHEGSVSDFKELRDRISRIILFTLRPER